MKAIELLMIGFIVLTTSTMQLSAQDVSAKDDVHWRDGECPACHKKVRLAFIVTRNVINEVDRDLFARVSGPQPEFYLINTCTHCYFSGYINDFDLTLAEETKKQLKRLKPVAPIAPDSNPRELCALEKYELAYQTHKILGRSDEALGWLALRASWVARDLHANLPRHDDLIPVLTEASRRVPVPEKRANIKDFNLADHELKQARALEGETTTSAPADGSRWAYDAVIGFLYRRHGENTPAEPPIERVLKNEQTPQAIREAFIKMKDSIEVERRWQKLAIEHFYRAVENKSIHSQNMPIAMYLLGQLSYRLEQHAEAKRWLDRASREDRLPPELVQWTLETQERIR